MTASGRDVVVVGAGLAGLTAALRLARAGASVTLVARGAGGLQLAQGTFDVLGYAPQRVTKPFDALPAFAAAHAGHPYALLGADAVRAAADFVAGAVGPALLTPPSDANAQLPTAVGAIRPTAAAPPSMLAADLSGPVDRSFVVVGLRRLKDFQAGLVAGNLARTPAPGGGALAARAVWVDVAARPGEHDVSGLTYARALDDPAFREGFARAIAPHGRESETVLLPAILGLHDHGAHAHLERLLDRPVAEVPLPPPGVPGLRLARALTSAARAVGVRFVNGAEVLGRVVEGGRLAAVTVGTAGRTKALPARAFVFAPGGFESGGLSVDSYGRITEPALGLPLTASSASGAISADLWGSEQALFGVGVRVDEAMRVLGSEGPVHDNLYAAGGILAGAHRWAEKSGEGVAAASALRAADHILQEAK